MQTRRSFLKSLSAALITAPAGFARPQPSGNESSLKTRAAANGLVYGASAVKSTLANDADYAEVFARECGVLATDWEAKWHVLHPTPTTYDFSATDWLFRFAAERHLLSRAHTLVWHLDLPSWFHSDANPANARKLLLSYIETVVGHFAGKAYSWDVVNEVINPDDGRPDSLRDSPWLRLVGPDYIETAFRAAAQADPKALLVYNEDSLEYDTPFAERKRTTVLKLLDRLKSKGVPIHALGVEAHLVAAEHPFSAPKLSRFLAEVSGRELQILVTELDVTDKHLSGSVSRRDEKIADEYARFLAPVLDNKSVSAVLTWGLSDRYTWLKKFAPRADGEPVRPLPLDASLNRKPAWYAVAAAFDHAPVRNSRSRL